MKNSARLRGLLKRPEIIVAPGGHYAFAGKIIEQTGGFQAVYLTGSGAAANTEHLLVMLGEWENMDDMGKVVKLTTEEYFLT